MRYEIWNFCEEHGFECKLLNGTDGEPQYGAPPIAYRITSAGGEQYMVVRYDNVFYVKVGGGNAFYVKESKEEQSEHDTIQSALGRVLEIHQATQSRREAEALAAKAKREAEARAEYNRRRSEIAAIVFASHFPISGNMEYSRDAEIVFDAAEAFLAEEAKRNGNTQ